MLAAVALTDVRVSVLLDSFSSYEAFCCLRLAVANVTYPDHLVASFKVRELKEVVALERKTECPKCSSPSSGAAAAGRPRRATRLFAASAAGSAPASVADPPPLTIQCRYTHATGPPLLKLQSYHGVDAAHFKLFDALSFELPVDGSSQPVPYQLSAVMLWDGGHYTALVPDEDAVSWWLFDCKKASAVRLSLSAAQSAVRGARSQEFFFSRGAALSFSCCLLTTVRVLFVGRVQKQIPRVLQKVPTPKKKRKRQKASPFVRVHRLGSFSSLRAWCRISKSSNAQAQGRELSRWQPGQARQAGGGWHGRV
jgi:hypothetical protein